VGSHQRRALHAALRIALSALAGVAFTCDEARAFALVPGGSMLAEHLEVSGDDQTDVADAELRSAAGAWQVIPWDGLGTHALEPGRYELRFGVEARAAGESVEVPPCAGRLGVRVDGQPTPSSPGPLLAPLGAGSHQVVLTLEVSAYERRIACGERPRVGKAMRTVEGLGTLIFDSPHARQGGGKAVVYVPPGHGLHRLDKVLVGLHPWNGDIWTYAAYSELLQEARAKGVLLLMPSGLGNSLYTQDAEDEVLRAIDALASVVIVPQSLDSVHGLWVSIWGASMGGAGATTVAFHHPDRFFAVTSFFGDSSYDLSTYVRAILPDAHAAHLVNALDVVDNARNLPVWLVHGENDATSPIRQSERLASAMQQRGFPVRFDRVPGMGHSGALVARFLPEVVDGAASPDVARVVQATRVSYRSVRPSDSGAYGVHIERASASGDAFIDIERRYDSPGFVGRSVLHVLHAEGVRAVDLNCVVFQRAAWQARPPIVVDDAAAQVQVRYQCGWL
jgi:pimeloyl-ACP methyl ester carboxylesterase